MKFKNLQKFIEFLEKHKELKKINFPVHPKLEITEIARRTILKKGPALFFQNPIGSEYPLLCNLFGNEKRILFGIGIEKKKSLRKIGKIFSFFRNPTPPKNFRDMVKKFSIYRRIFHTYTKEVKYASCQEIVVGKKKVDLFEFPIMHCWPKDSGKLITWGITTTKSLSNNRQNLGIYRLQVISKNKLLIRWFPQRGGEIDFQEWKKNNKEKFPISIFIGSDPITILSAVMPVPNSLSEYSISGILRGKNSKVVKCVSNDLRVPENSEIVLEGFIEEKSAKEGPNGDHTGFYNKEEYFPIINIEVITRKKYPIYLSTYSGKYPDETSVLSYYMNEILIPIIQKQFPEISDFYLPPEACSYRIALVSIKKKYPGHAKKIMMGIWSFLQQFMYIKIIIVCEDDVNIRDWREVFWSISTCVDPYRDSLFIKYCPSDILDFASFDYGIGSKMGIDATEKLKAESRQTFQSKIFMNKETCVRIEKIWKKLKIFS
ncbi:UbiD family decarboxylase [bacterium endosymbiont of Pedicinus badii]|uniref:UbiD family decarboxylase n=1 Tax=bacterium endosymbiont of Pedicinus badii TaxID=1719126 RepID=UPI0009BC11AD|nr:UbiD family decarboxylase [bacterium endosymbiont of Pedicinus badii]OQM34262.1 3-octaprenyl-4-hydroxybenzoate carboxy-lyase [bacterium endosymbiont of Pedicinus badii]